MNIYQKLAAITDELGVVAKGLEVSTGKGKGYKAVSERDIIDAVKPLEKKYGIYSYPSFREIIDRKEIEVTNDYGTKVQFFTRVLTTYTFVNCDNPEEKIDTYSYAEGIDAQDKGAGKAMTYSDKYALMKIYKISTGDDPDAKASSDMYKATPGKPSVDIQPVSETNKKFLKDIAKDLGVNLVDVLHKTGWKEGEQLNQEQYSKAVGILKAMSDERNS